MSKSLKRVRAALEAAGLGVEIVEMPESTKTAEAAAQAVGCEVDQIAKSIIFFDDAADQVVLFITAGGQRVDPEKAAACAGAPLSRADAGIVRAKTGFAIGGVSPIGHLTEPRRFFDRRLLEFDRIWAAAGTPNHVFGVSPQELVALTEAELADFTA
ncbi:MAG: YbaK/EbsC family protein [Pseudomonadota bacterium]